MEYLDKEGLRYYNSKIQTQINAKANDGDLSAVAKSGSYNDLTNKPSIPPEITVDSALSTTSTNPVQNNLVTNALNSKVSSSNVVDNLTSVGANVPLSAKQGKILNESKLEASNIKAGENIVLSKSGNDITISSTGGGGGGSSVAVIDNLNSSSAVSALSANQGRVLDGKITGVADTVDTNSDDIDSLESDVATLQTNVTNMTADIASLTGSLDDKLDASNILAGTNIAINTDTNNNVTISSSASSVSKYSLTELKALTDPTDDLFLSLKADIINHNPMVITYNYTERVGPYAAEFSDESAVLSSSVETVEAGGVEQTAYIICFRKNKTAFPSLMFALGFIGAGESLTVQEILLPEKYMMFESGIGVNVVADEIDLDQCENGTSVKSSSGDGITLIANNGNAEYQLDTGISGVFLCSSKPGNYKGGYLLEPSEFGYRAIAYISYDSSRGWDFTVLDQQFSGSYNDLTNKPLYGDVKICYTTCSTAGGTTIKQTEPVEGYSDGNAAIIKVKFDNALTCNNPQLRVGYWSAYNIYSRDTNAGLPAGAWGAGDIVTFYWDGSAFRAIAGLRATTTNYGEAKLSSSVSSTSTTEAATSSAVRQAYNLASGKQDALVSGTNIKTINGTSILGSGNINISVAVDSALSSTSENPVQNKVINSALNNKANSSDIPTKISDLTNDSGFISSYTETDPVFSASAAHGITSSDISSWNNKSDFSGSYTDLTDKPTIPSKTSDLTNDSDFVTKTSYASNQNGGVIKTDTSTYGTSMYSGYLTGSTRTYSQYNSAANALFVSKGTLENVITGKGLATSSDIPTKVSDLTNDSGFITSYTETDPVFSASAASGITSSDISSWNNKSTFSGDYDDLTNKPTIPTATSDLTNDSGFITSSYHDSSKQDALVSGTNIKTINGNSILGNGDISLAGGETLKVGTILPFSGSTLPTGYLFCDGSAVSRTTYAGLFDVIGTTFGAGDGSTTFNLPNLKGKVPVGLDSNDTDFDTLGETGGEKEHTLTINEMPSHNHNGGILTNNTVSGGARYYFNSAGATNGTNFSNSLDISNTGGSQPHNIVQPYIVINYIIKASQTAPVQAQIVDGYSESTTDGYSANYVNGLNTYSTTETRIGTWIDGKPIYRKAFTFTTPPENVDYIINTGASIDTAIKLYGGIKESSGGITPIPTAIDFSGTIYTTSFRVANSSIYYRGNSTYGSKPAYAIIEYTKTTD